MLNSNKEEIRKIKRKVYVDNRNIYSSFENAKKVLNAFFNRKISLYMSECSTLKGLLNFPFKYIIAPNGEINETAKEVYTIMKDKMLQTIYGGEK